jgi:hypothetical protein
MTWRVHNMNIEYTLSHYMQAKQWLKQVGKWTPKLAQAGFVRPVEYALELYRDTTDPEWVYSFPGALEQLV